MTNKIKMFLIFALAVAFSVLGAFIMLEKMEGSFKEMINQTIETNASNYLLLSITSLAGSLTCHYLLSFGQIEILKV